MGRADEVSRPVAATARLTASTMAAPVSGVVRTTETLTCKVVPLQVATTD